MFPHTYFPHAQPFNVCVEDEFLVFVFLIYFLVYSCDKKKDVLPLHQGHILWLYNFHLILNPTHRSTYNLSSPTLCAHLSDILESKAIGSTHKPKGIPTYINPCKMAKSKNPLAPPTIVSIVEEPNKEKNDFEDSSSSWSIQPKWTPHNIINKASTPSTSSFGSLHPSSVNSPRKWDSPTFVDKVNELCDG